MERDKFKLTLYDLVDRDPEYRVMRRYPIAVGAQGFRTPRGMFRINSRMKDPDWLVPNSEWVPAELAGQVIKGGDPRNPLKARWLGVTAPLVGVGIHGTSDENSLGSAASHGCIRMAVSDVEELYPEVPLGTPVLIM